MPTPMPNKSRCHSKLVATARAGIIPASDDIEDEAEARLNHAAHLIRTMRRIAPYTSHANEQLVLTEILADLRYHCATKGLPFEELDAAAILNNHDWHAVMTEIGLP